MIDPKESAYLKAKKIETNLFFGKKSFTKRNPVATERAVNYD